MSGAPIILDQAKLMFASPPVRAMVLAHARRAADPNSSTAAREAAKAALRPWIERVTDLEA